MPNKMERFTQRARRVLSLAQEEAERNHYQYIGTEHMLMGLLREEGGIAGRVLRDLGLDERRVNDLIEELNNATAKREQGQAELSPGSKKILELAVDEARRMGHHYIGTEHLLLGLVRLPDGIAIEVLKRLGVSPEEVRRQTRRVLQESPTQTNPPPQTKAEAASAILHPNQPMTRLPADAYELLENVLMRILEMIEAGKLPVAQGVELFSTLTPDLKLAPGQQAQLISHLFENTKFNDYQVRVTAKDANGVEQLNIDKLAFPTLLAAIDQILSAALNEPEKPLTFTLGDSTLEVWIEKDQTDE